MKKLKEKSPELFKSMFPAFMDSHFIKRILDEAYPLQDVNTGLNMAIELVIEEEIKENTNFSYELACALSDELTRAEFNI